MRHQEPGAVVENLGRGVTVVERVPPRTGAWVAPFSVNCEDHGWTVSRATQEQAASEARGHIGSEHTGALAVFHVSRRGQRCCGGMEPLHLGAKAYEDGDGWVWCPVHVPELPA